MQWPTLIFGGSVESPLVVTFDLLPQTFKRWWEPTNGTCVILWMQVLWWMYHEVVGTLKNYLMQKNLFDLFALTGSGYAKTLGAQALRPSLAPKPPAEISTT